MSLPDSPILVSEFEKLFKENKLYRELAFYYLSKELHHEGIYIFNSSGYN